ncbi:thiamine pyrophosphate-binding protein [Amycolatopsis vancoresmycina]|uniref:Thiamine pyrophosphate TPP binding domain-containing protein n=1 Tax=Amycolatopsis vancoresmycina DSM 44592 TaxID=1292037 RepID=R1G9T3_9PSEU|nr:thiamine pyrophosphate-binding protein [Amycolatopsis vancoresmycina]EOD68147.1 thiamine pyrophosphate TPP binding domain-containing protein [Amycolatopsis vancoresmycina DSM 44592]
MTARAGRVAMLEQFAADGMTRMFGNPGTVEQGFLDELENFPGIGYVLGLQEAAVVGIADGYARAGGRPALVQLHTGVGLGNGIGMLYQAMRGHSPLVVIAGEAGVRYDALDAQMAADLVAMARPVTKYATRVLHPGSLLRVLRRAVKIAMTPPRGPVFVSLPMDVLDELTTEPAVRTVVPTRAVLPVPGELDRAAALLASAQQPIVLLGDGVSVSGAQAELTRVAELLNAPVWGVNDSEVNMDTTHPLYRGQLGHMFGTHSAGVVAGADAVLIAGTYVFPEVFPELRSPFAPGAKIVHVDLNDYEVAKNFPVDVPLVADPKPTLAALGDLLADELPDTGWTDLARHTWTAPEVTDDSPLAERFAAALAAQAGPDLVVFDEALTASPGLVKHLPPRVPGNYFLTRGGSLGVGITGAIGAKLARPEAQVVGFTGDGGSMYTPQALWTAARYGIAARFVVCNNGRYRLLDHNLDQYRAERGIEPHGYPGGFALGDPEIGFVELAAAMGVDGVRVAKVSEVDDAVERMLAASGPFLIDLVTA